jgi:hypothetical protein
MVASALVVDVQALQKLAQAALGFQVEPFTLLNQVWLCASGSAPRPTSVGRDAPHARALLWLSPHQRAEGEKAGLRPRPLRMRKPLLPSWR